MLKHKHKKMIRRCYCIRFSHDNLQQVSGLHHHYCTFGNMYVCEVRYIPQYITVIPQKKVFWNVGEFNQFYGHLASQFSYLEWYHGRGIMYFLVRDRTRVCECVNSRLSRPRVRTAHGARARCTVLSVLRAPRLFAFSAWPNV